MISKNTATDIALAYREIETAEKLLAEITEARNRHEVPDIRDAFGRLQSGLQLGVPSGGSANRLFQVQWSIAIPVLQAHIAHQKTLISMLNVKARAEMETPSTDTSSGQAR